MLSVPFTVNYSLEVLRPDGTHMEVRKRNTTGTYVFHKRNFQKGMYLIRIHAGNKSFCRTFILL